MEDGDLALRPSEENQPLLDLERPFFAREEDDDVVSSSDSLLWFLPGSDRRLDPERSCSVRSSRSNLLSSVRVYEMAPAALVGVREEVGPGLRLCALRKLRWRLW